RGELTDDRMPVMSKRKATMLTVSKVAERLGVLDSSVRIWARQGRFPGAELHESQLWEGSYWLIPESALDGFERRSVGRPRKGTEPARKAASQKASKRARKS